MKKLKVCSGDYALVDDDIYAIAIKDHWHFDGSKVFKGRAESYKTLHSFAMGDSSKPGLMRDHKDRNPLNNQRSNLRWATPQQNSFNTSPQPNKTSKFKGVHVTISRAHRPKPYRAMIQINRKKVHIGYFKTEIEAALAYNKKAKELFGEFAYLNQVGESKCSQQS